LAYLLQIELVKQISLRIQKITKSAKIGFIGVDLYKKLRNMKMLLIDDDEWIRDSLSIFFESEGCYLKAFETAEEGLKALKKQSYDIIIVDYRLPGMDGLDFLRRIKNSCSNAIKIMVTAYGNKEIISEAKEIGIQDFLEKPISSKSIEASLSRLIEEHDQQSERT